MRSQRFFGACLIGILALCGVSSEGAAQQVIRAQTADGVDLKIEIIRLEDFRVEDQPQTMEESLLRFAAGGEPRFGTKGNLAEIHDLHPDAPPYEEIDVLRMFLHPTPLFLLEQPPLTCGNGPECAPPSAAPVSFS